MEIAPGSGEGRGEKTQESSSFKKEVSKEEDTRRFRIEVDGHPILFGAPIS